MAVTLDIFELRAIVETSAELGAEKILDRLGVIKDTISQREAYTAFGPAWVKTYENLGIIKSVKTGANTSKRHYSRKELEVVKNLEKLGKIKK